MNNSLFSGDNLEALKYLYKNGYEGKIDLIYIDPPFNTGRKDFAYNDSWKSVNDYLDFLRSRLFWMRELLSDKGSIYVHLDWRVGHYVKIMMDRIFGDKNFVAECIWHYSWGVRTARRWNRKHDNIFMYKKGEDWLFNSNDVLEDRMLSDRSLNRLQYKGALIRDKNKRGSNEKALPSDVWYIPTVNGMAKERIGYPTQKPEALLELIIKASSNPGDIVADFFAGSGTTGAVAEKLGRRWIMCDSSPKAIQIIKERMKDCSFDYQKI